ncbi:MAG: DUF2059 domain-containing protein [Sandarakinorhabdus sp.]|nr:DUF2059 domain-containing protein [Sandarakinorhabdus sp.]
MRGWHLALAAALLPLVGAAGAVPVTSLAAAPAPIDPLVVTPPRGTRTSPVDPARLTAASEVAALLMPVGSLRQALQPNIDRMSGGARNAMLNTAMRDFVRYAAIKPSAQIRIDEATATKAMTAMDPAFGQRQAIITDMIATRIGAIIDAHDPLARASLGVALANRLSVADLTALLAFLRTPAGAAYLEAQPLIGRDPANVESSKVLMTRLDGVVPGAIKDIIAATADLPKVRRYVDLKEGEKAQVYKLIGATPASATSR